MNKVWLILRSSVISHYLRDTIENGTGSRRLGVKISRVPQKDRKREKRYAAGRSAGILYRTTNYSERAFLRGGTLSENFLNSRAREVSLQGCSLMLPKIFKICPPWSPSDRYDYLRCSNPPPLNTDQRFRGFFNCPRRIWTKSVLARAKPPNDRCPSEL